MTLTPGQWYWTWFIALLSWKNFRIAFYHRPKLTYRNEFASMHSFSDWFSFLKIAENKIIAFCGFVKLILLLKWSYKLYKFDFVWIVLKKTLRKSASSTQNNNLDNKLNFIRYDLMGSSIIKKVTPHEVCIDPKNSIMDPNDRSEISRANFRFI